MRACQQLGAEVAEVLRVVELVAVDAEHPRGVPRTARAARARAPTSTSGAGRDGRALPRASGGSPKCASVRQWSTTWIRSQNAATLRIACSTNTVLVPDEDAADDLSSPRARSVAARARRAALGAHERTPRRGRRPRPHRQPRRRASDPGAAAAGRAPTGRRSHGRRLACAASSARRADACRSTSVPSSRPRASASSSTTSDSILLVDPAAPQRVVSLQVVAGSGALDVLVNASPWSSTFRIHCARERSGKCSTSSGCQVVSVRNGLPASA